jgi:hypothetical protein
MRELRPITYDYGYVNDDEVDVAETYGSDSFEAQTRQSQTIYQVVIQQFRIMKMKVF